MAHGVRKVDEYLIKNGRAIIFTSNINSLDSNETWNSIENGSLYINPDFGTLQFKSPTSEKGIWDWFDAVNIIKKNTITNELIKDRELNNSKFANASISTRTLEDYCVTSDKIMKESILEKHFAPKSLSGRIFMDNSIDGNKIVENSITGSKITERTIDKIAIKINSITGDEIKDSSIQGYKIISLSGKQIEDNSISGAKIEFNTIAGKNIIPYTISNLNLADGCIKNNNLSSLCVNADNIGNQQITNTKYKNLSIDNSKIMDNTIKGIKLEDNTITGEKIANSTVGLSNMDDNVKDILNNSVLYENGVVKIKGNVVVSGNVLAENNNCTQTITGFKVFNPVFKDFAEAFEYNGIVELGDIVEISESGKIIKAGAFSNNVVGVISDSYAMCLGATEEEILNGSKVAVGLLGRIKVNVIGKVKAGDTIICIGDGKGKAIKEDHIEPLHNCIIGRALESSNNVNNKKILCLIHIL